MGISCVDIILLRTNQVLLREHAAPSIDSRSRQGVREGQTEVNDAERDNGG